MGILPFGHAQIRSRGVALEGATPCDDGRPGHGVAMEVDDAAPARDGTVGGLRATHAIVPLVRNREIAAQERVVPGHRSEQPEVRQVTQLDLRQPAGRHGAQGIAEQLPSRVEIAGSVAVCQHPRHHARDFHGEGKVAPGKCERARCPQPREHIVMDVVCRPSEEGLRPLDARAREGIVAGMVNRDIGLLDQVANVLGIRRLARRVVLAPQPPCPERGFGSIVVRAKRELDRLLKVVSSELPPRERTGDGVPESFVCFGDDRIPAQRFGLGKKPGHLGEHLLARCLPLVAELDV